jgi:hypothetical protein
MKNVITRVSSMLSVSCFWDIRHPHVCSFNKVGVKWIHSLLVKALCFHVHFYLVQPRLHLLGFGLFLYERV